jgi:hypothetical protein
VHSQVGRLPPRSLLVRTQEYVHELREVTRHAEPQRQEQVRLHVRRCQKSHKELQVVRVSAFPTGDAESSLCDAKSSLGDAESSLGDAKSLLGDAKSSLGDAKSWLGDAKSSLG